MNLNGRIKALEKQYPPRRPVMAECILPDGSEALLTIDEMIVNNLNWTRLHGCNQANISDVEKLLAYMKECAEREATP